MAKYMNEGGNKGGPAKRVKGPGQPMSRGGYRSPWGGPNEMGEDQLSMAKRSMNRGSSKGQKDAQNQGLTGGAPMAKNEMDY